MLTYVRVGVTQAILRYEDSLVDDEVVSWRALAVSACRREALVHDHLQLGIGGRQDDADVDRRTDVDLRRLVSDRHTARNSDH